MFREAGTSFIGGVMADIITEIMLSEWDNVRLLKEFETRVELHKSMVGTLYPNILIDVIETLGQEAIKRTGHHPNHWRDQGIVPASWTDHLGITHTWNHNHQNYARKPDDPVKDITCFECMLR